MTEVTVGFATRTKRTRALQQKAPEPPYPARVARELALAHALQARLDAGEFRDHADMARALGFTRARVSQIMDLLLLAPDIQEEVLFADYATRVTGHALRALVRRPCWDDQRREWVRLRSQ
jgi:ParB-like chromosome segregation protein Spo0J